MLTARAHKFVSLMGCCRQMLNLGGGGGGGTGTVNSVSTTSVAGQDSYVIAQLSGATIVAVFLGSIVVDPDFYTLNGTSLDFDAGYVFDSGLTITVLFK